MSMTKAFSNRRFLRRAPRTTTSTHLTKTERNARADMLFCAMSAPEGDRRYATYLTTLR